MIDVFDGEGNRHTFKVKRNKQTIGRRKRLTCVCGRTFYPAGRTFICPWCRTGYRLVKASERVGLKPQSEEFSPRAGEEIKAGLVQSGASK